MIDALIADRLHGKPVERPGPSSKPSAVCKVRTPLQDGETAFVSVIAFDPGVCRLLLAMDAGDSVALSGTLTPKVWTDLDGAAKPALGLVAHSLTTVYHVSRKRQSAREGSEARLRGNTELTQEIHT
jgi:hypothetical protein